MEHLQQNMKLTDSSKVNLYENLRISIGIKVNGNKSKASIISKVETKVDYHCYGDFYTWYILLLVFYCLFGVLYESCISKDIFY